MENEKRQRHDGAKRGDEARQAEGDEQLGIDAAA
jgi:hypothetical protein